MDNEEKDSITDIGKDNLEEKMEIGSKEEDKDKDDLNDKNVDNDEDDDDEEEGEEWESEEVEDGSDDEDEDEDEDDEEDEDEESDGDLSGNSDTGEESENCPICLGRIKDQDIGTPESCDHIFCLECIQEWSKNVNTCPVDRQVYNIIIVKKPGVDKVYDRITVEDRNQQDEEEEDELDETACEICGHSDREDRLLLCDGCDLGYHCECLSPPLSEIPVEEWFCPDCANREGLAETVDDADEVQNIIAENRPLNRRLRYQRRIARTRVSERVRARIQRHRAERHGLWTSSEEEDDGEEEENGENIQTEEAAPLQMATSAASSITSASTSRTSAAPSTNVTKKRKTTTKTSTKKKRKRKTTRKKKRKSTSGKTKKRKTKKRKTKKKSSKVCRVSDVKRTNSVKGRIASTLGLSKPPTGRIIPLQKKSGEKSLDDQRHDVGATSLSILGGRNDLIGFEDDDSLEVQSIVSTVKSKGYSTTFQPTSKYSKSALLSHRPVRLSCSVTRRKQLPKSESAVSAVDTLSQTAPVGVHRGGPFDILGSIMHSQGKLHQHSKDITIKRDGSLVSTKPIKAIPLSSNTERIGRITLSMPGGVVDKSSGVKETNKLETKKTDSAVQKAMDSTTPELTSTSSFLASLMTKPSESNSKTEISIDSNKLDKIANTNKIEKSETTESDDSVVNPTHSNTRSYESVPQIEGHKFSEPQKLSDEVFKDTTLKSEIKTGGKVKSSNNEEKKAGCLSDLTFLGKEKKTDIDKTLEEDFSEDLDYIDDAQLPSPPAASCKEINLSDDVLESKEKNEKRKTGTEKQNYEDEFENLTNISSPPDSPCAELNLTDTEVEDKQLCGEERSTSNEKNFEDDLENLGNALSPPDSPCAELNLSDTEIVIKQNGEEPCLEKKNFEVELEKLMNVSSPPDSPCAELNLSDNEVEDKTEHVKWQSDSDKKDLEDELENMTNLPSPPYSPCAELNLSDFEEQDKNQVKDMKNQNQSLKTDDELNPKSLTNEDKLKFADIDKIDTDIKMPDKIDTIDKTKVITIDKRIVISEKNSEEEKTSVSKCSKRYRDERDDPYTDSETEFDSDIISAWKTDTDKNPKKPQPLDKMINPKHLQKDGNRNSAAAKSKIEEETTMKKVTNEKKKNKDDGDSDESMTGMEVVDEVGGNSDAYLEDLNISPGDSPCAELNEENSLEDELMNMNVPSPEGSPCAELNLSEGELNKDEQGSDLGEIIEEPGAQYSPVIDAREVINKIIEEKTREKINSQFSKRRSDHGSPRISIGQLLDGDVGRRSRRIYRKHRSSENSSSDSDDSGEEGEVKSRSGHRKHKHRHRKRKDRSSDDDRRGKELHSSSSRHKRKTQRKHKHIEPADYSVNVLTRMDMLDGKANRGDRDKRNERRDNDRVRVDSPERRREKRDDRDRDSYRNQNRDPHWDRDQRTSRFERERTEKDVRNERNFRSDRTERTLNERYEREHRSDRELRPDRDHSREQRSDREHKSEREFRSDREHRSDREQRSDREHRSNREHRLDRYKSREERVESPHQNLPGFEKEHESSHRRHRRKSKSLSSSPHRSRSSHREHSIEHRKSRSKDFEISQRKKRDRLLDEEPTVRDKSPFWDHERRISPVDWNRSPVVEKSPEREIIVRRRHRVRLADDRDNSPDDVQLRSKKRRKDKNKEKRDRRPRSPRSPPPEEDSPILLSDLDLDKEPEVAPKPKKKGRKKRKGKRKKGPPAPPGMFFTELEDDAILVGEIEPVEIEIPDDESDEENINASKATDHEAPQASDGQDLYDPLQITSPHSRSSCPPSPRSHVSATSKTPDKEKGSVSDDPSDYDPAHPTDDDFKLVKSPAPTSPKPSSPKRIVVIQSPQIVETQSKSPLPTPNLEVAEIPKEKSKSPEPRLGTPDQSPEPLSIDIAPEKIASPSQGSQVAPIGMQEPVPPVVTPVKPSVSPIFSSPKSSHLPSPKMAQDDRTMPAPPNKSPIAIVKPSEPIISSIVPPVTVTNQPSPGLFPTPVSAINQSSLPVGQVFPLQTTDSSFTLPRPMSSTLTSIMNGSKMHVEPAPRPRSLLSLPFPPLTSNQTRPRFNQLAEINRLLNTQARLAGIRPDPKTGGVFKIPAPPTDTSETLEVIDMDIDKDSGDDVSSPSEDECELMLPQSPAPKRKKDPKKRHEAKDEIPSSAADLGKKQKYVRKLHLQERVIEEVKLAIKPFYSSKKITKEQYKEILRRAVPKICHSKAKDVNPMKIKLLVEAYVKKFQKKKKKKTTEVTVTTSAVADVGNKTVVTARWLKSIKNNFTATS